MDAMTTTDEHRVKGGDHLRLLDAAAAAAPADPAAAIALVPWLGASIDADAAAARFGRWGRSTVIDENTGSAVVPAGLFDALHERAGVEATFPAGNAGLLHVYGYLLSATPTPYGLKRERWLDGALARAYGLAADAFLPWTWPAAGTLLTRVEAAASALLATGIVHEEPVGDAVARIAIARRASSGPAALAYALDRGGDRRVITTFPVASPDAVLAEVRADGPRLRWNAVA